MITYMEGALGASREYREMEEKFLALRRAYAASLVEYTDLVTVIRPELESQYMVKIGKKEHELFLEQLQYRRLRRELVLYQAAANRGEVIAPETVKHILDKEFAEYEKTLLDQQKKIEAAEVWYGAEKMPREQVEILRKLYRELVKKLHPDLHPDLPASAGLLWPRITEAYRRGDLPELQLLADMAEDALQGREATILPGALEQLQEEYNALQARHAALQEKMEACQARPPFTFRELLNDPAQVLKRRQELTEEIRCCRENITAVTAALQQLKG